MRFFSRLALLLLILASVASAQSYTIQNYGAWDNSNTPSPSYVFFNPTVTSDMVAACAGTNPTTYAGAFTGPPTIVPSGNPMAILPDATATTGDGLLNQTCWANFNMIGGINPTIQYNTANTVTGPTVNYAGGFSMEVTGSSPWLEDHAVTAEYIMSSATSYQSPSITITHAPEMLICFGTQGAGTGGAFSGGGGGGWATTGFGTAFGSQAITFQYVTSPGTYTGCPVTTNAGTNDYVFTTIGFYVSSAVVTTYYIAPASLGGSDSNNGRTPTSPWLTPKHNLPCGDVILAEPSTGYLGDNLTEGNWGTVTCGTGNSANVVWLKCEVAFACAVTATNNNGAFWVDQPFWGVQGWVATNLINSSYAGACYEVAPNIGSPSEVHHVIFANDVAIGCETAGFGGTNSPGSTTNSVDYFLAIGTISYNTAQGAGPSDGNCGEGIEMFEPVASDSLPGTHFFFDDNFVFDAVDGACNTSGSPPLPTDGEAIIFDTFNFAFTPGGTPYAQQSVAKNTIGAFNGGRGILVGGGGNSAGSIYILHNTMYGNNTQLQNTTICGEFATNVDSGKTIFGYNIGATTGQYNCGHQPWYAYGINDSTPAVKIPAGFGYSPVGQSCTDPAGTFSCAAATNTIFTGNPSFANPVNPSAPNCSSFVDVNACMATIIANFTPTNTAAIPYGYQGKSASATPYNYDQLWPQWLCNDVTGIINQLVTTACAPATDPLGLQFFPTTTSSAPANVWVTTSMVKTQQQAGSPTDQQTYIGYAAQNEFHRFDTCVQAGGSPVTLNGSISNLVNSITSTTISSSNIIPYMQGYYNVGIVSDNDYTSALGWQPSVLVPKVDPYYGQTTSFFPRTVASGQNQCISWEVHVPFGTTSGYYTGTVTLTNGGTLATIGVTIGVFNYAISSTSTLTGVYESDRSSMGAAYYGGGSPSAGYTGGAAFPGASGSADLGRTLMNAALCAILLDHRTGPSECEYPLPSTPPNNWTNFTTYFGCYLSGTPCGSTPNTLLQGAKITLTGYNLKDGNVANIEDWVNTFHNNGWKSPFVYLCDEAGCVPPSGLSNVNTAANPYNDCLGSGGASPPMAVLVTRWLADAQNGESSPFYPPYISCVNILSPNTYTLWPYNQPNTRSSYNSFITGGTPAPFTAIFQYQACSGHQYYGNCFNGSPGSSPPVYPSPMIDASAARNRAMQWTDFMQGVSGDLYYAVDYCFYNSNCFNGNNSASGNDPWIFRYYSAGHGDGTLLYPCTYAKVGTGSSASWSPFPCAGIELKNLRDSFQDYECLETLKLNGYNTLALAIASTFITQGVWQMDETPGALLNAKQQCGNAVHQLGSIPPPPAPTPAAPPYGGLLRIKFTEKVKRALHIRFD